MEKNEFKPDTESNGGTKKTNMGKIYEIKKEQNEKIDEVKQEQLEKIDQIRKEQAEKIDQIMKEQSEKIDEIKKEQAEKVDGIKKEQAEKIDEIKQKRTQKIDEFKQKRLEKKYKNEESKRKRHEELQKRHEEILQKNEEKKHELSAELKQLLSKDITAAKKKEKTRSAEILSIFAKHNFYAAGFTPVELRTTLEDMGPTYVKIGQIMSSRTDILPDSYCKELTKLRSNVKPLDPSVARAVIEQETGKKIDEIFREFRDEPLGSASIAQAHYGVLKNGMEVVTKVQRPLIADMMRKDFVLLKKLGSMLNTVSGDEEAGTIDLVSVIDELEHVTEEELDFRIEAENTRFFKENCIEDETVVSCPTIIDELSTERILTMTFVDGCSVSKRERLIEEGCDLEKIGKDIVENYVHQVLDVGCFHADPHQGNIMVAHGIPYWIDFGMIGHISEATINLLQDLILSLIHLDLEGVVNAAMAMGAASPKTNRGKVVDDLDAFISKYMSVSTLNDLDMGTLMSELTDLLSANYIQVPGEFTMLVRSLITIEGVIEELCPDLKLFKFLTDKLLARAKKNTDLEQELLASGKEALSYGKKAVRLPVLASDALSGLAKGRTKLNIEMTGYEALVEKAAATVKNVILAIFSCILFLGSCILCTTDIQPQMSNGVPFLAAAGLIFSVSLAIYTVRRMTKKK